MYTIIDIETTGNGIQGNKITEIAIFKYDGYEIIDEYTSLVNPECEISQFITSLTGIDNHMVRNAPTIDQIADTIIEFTKDTIFVAHSVNFDYNVIKNEFKNINLEFVRKKLCTVRLSRKLIPGLNSYSLGKLCASLKIPLTDRHRARGDAHATTLLFKMLLRADGASDVFKSFLNSRSQEATLPPQLPKAIFDKIQEKPGVYYFKNSKGKIIYIGKAKNLKKRVLSHFYDKATKEIQLCQEIADIDFELSGSELLALLMESEAIKQHYPKYNQAQKRKLQQFGIFSYEDRKGILHVAFNRIKMAPNPIYTSYKLADCRLYLEKICEEFQLCPKFCHLQENVNNCSHFRIKNCNGICSGDENIADYNIKVQKAIDYIRSSTSNFIIKEQGRNNEEDAFILVNNDIYLGYGFIKKETTISTSNDLQVFLTPQKNTAETQSIIKSFLSKNPNKCFPIKASLTSDLL